MTDIDAKVEVINTRMLRNRIDQNRDVYKGWTQAKYMWPIKPRDVIREHILAGHKVTAGYYTTSVRGFHNYCIFWRE
jgi:hypothetical protein